MHDFMVNDSLDGPELGALWALQHVTVNADGLGLCPAEVIKRLAVVCQVRAQTLGQQIVPNSCDLLGRAWGPMSGRAASTRASASRSR